MTFKVQKLKLMKTTDDIYQLFAVATGAGCDVEPYKLPLFGLGPSDWIRPPKGWTVLGNPAETKAADFNINSDQEMVVLAVQQEGQTQPEDHKCFKSRLMLCDICHVLFE